jgi:mRNA interferase MazF
VIRRGEVWWANLPIPIGSEPGHRRPVVIVQADIFNVTSLETFIAVGITSNVGLADQPGNVFISSRSSGLSKDSVGNVTQLVTGDRSMLSECIGVLSERELRRLNAGLRLVLDLDAEPWRNA